MKSLSLYICHWIIRQIVWFREAVKTKAFWADVIVFLCGTFFLYAAIDKLRNHDAFRVQVGKSPILTGYEDFIAWSIPAIEILIALLMVPLGSRQVGLCAFFTLMLTFAGYIVMLIMDGSLVPCGCNALTEDLSLEAHIVMNVCFCAVAALALFLSPPEDFFITRKHATYRRFIEPVGSRIRFLVKRITGKEANGSEYR